tara:strand:- start:723 stop:1589 length:867 start_codon:yes stop_codon:yes gene_type:complete
MLPLAPPDPTGSPYSSPSCFALNAWFLDASDLANEEFISQDALNGLPGASVTTAETTVLDFPLANQRSEALADALLEAWPQQTPERQEAFRNWCSQQSWLEDHVSFSVLHAQHNNAWWTWPKPLAQHQRRALKAWAADNQTALMKERLMQWQLDRQWQEIRRLAHDLGVVLFGDLPFYVSTDSADVWSHRGLFTVKESGELTLQSGVPPDYFSETGQLWGSPVIAGDDTASPASSGGANASAANGISSTYCDWIISAPLPPFGPFQGVIQPLKTVNGNHLQATPCWPN